MGFIRWLTLDLESLLALRLGFAEVEGCVGDRKKHDVGLALDGDLDLVVALRRDGHQRRGGPFRIDQRAVDRDLAGYFQTLFSG